MKKIKLILCLMMGMIIFSGCSMIKNNENLAKVNNTVITKTEFIRAYEEVTSNNMFSQMGIDLKDNPDNIFSLMMKEKVMSELIVKALLNEEMKQRKIEISKDELSAAEKEIISKFGSKEQFEQILKLNGVSYDKFRKDLEDEMKLKKLVDSIAMVSIGDAEAKKYYDENSDKFRYPQRVRASHILIAANPEQIKVNIKKENKDISDEELEKRTAEEMQSLKEKAEKLYNKVKAAPSTFAKVAKENSQDSVSAVKGGDLGFFAKDEMVEPFAEKAFSMAPNTISEVIQTPYGYHIIKVTDRAEAGTMSFEQTKNDIINYLESRDKVDILKSKIATLKNEAKIEYYDENYNPEKIQEKIKKAAAENPQTQEAFNANAPQENK